MLMQKLLVKGKSLSLICGALTWLRDHRAKDLEEQLHSDGKGKHRHMPVEGWKSHDLSQMTVSRNGFVDTLREKRRIGSYGKGPISMHV
jgi:hypothetical protein